MRDIAHYLVAPGAVEGVAVSLLLDTGAEGGLIAPEAAAALHLPMDPRRVTQMQGPAGEVIGRNALARHVQLGPLLLQDASLPVGVLPAVPRTTPPVVGLIGADVLSRFDVELDAPHGRMALYATAGCESGFVPFPSANMLPLTREGDRVRVDVVLDGQRLPALVDTGARSTIVSPAAAALAGVTEAALARDPGGIGGGVDMRRTEFHWHRFGTFRVGAEAMRSHTLTVSPLGDEMMLLGNDWLLTRHVWISYAQNRLFVQPAISPAPHH